MRLWAVVAALVCVGLMGTVCRAAESIFTYDINATSFAGGTLTGDFVVEGPAGDNFFDSTLISFSAEYSLGSFSTSWDPTDFAGGSDLTPDADLSGVLGDPVLTPQLNEDDFAFFNPDFYVLELGFTDFSNAYLVPPGTDWVFGFAFAGGPSDGGTWQLDLASTTSAAAPLPGGLAMGIAGMAGLAVFGLRRTARAKIG
jgi:hypothetical protein